METRPSLKTQDQPCGFLPDCMLRFAREAQVVVEERAFSIEEAQGADEAFVTSASTFLMPVVEIDGAVVVSASRGLLRCGCARFIWKG